MDKLSKLPLNFGSAASAVLPPPITGKKKPRDYSADLTNSFNGLGFDEDSGLLMSFGENSLGEKKQLPDKHVTQQESEMLQEIVRLLRKYDTEDFPETIVGRKGYAGEGELNIFAQWLKSMGYGDIGERKNTKGGANIEFNIRYLAREVNYRGVSLEDLIKDMFGLSKPGQNYGDFRGDVIIALYNTLTGKQPVYSEAMQEEEHTGGRKKSRRNKKKKKSRKARKTRRCKKKYKGK